MHLLSEAVLHRQVTQMLLDGRDELKYSARAIILLIGIQAVDMKALDQHFAKAIETGRNLIALSCSIKLINALTAAERSERPLTDVRVLLFHLSVGMSDRSIPRRWTSRKQRRLWCTLSATLGTFQRAQCSCWRTLDLK